MFESIHLHIALSLHLSKLICEVCEGYKIDDISLFVAGFQLTAFVLFTPSSFKKISCF